MEPDSHPSSQHVEQGMTMCLCVLHMSVGSGPRPKASGECRGTDTGRRPDTPSGPIPVRALPSKALGQHSFHRHVLLDGAHWEFGILEAIQLVMSKVAARRMRDGSPVSLIAHSQVSGISGTAQCNVRRTLTGLRRRLCALRSLVSYTFDVRDATRGATRRSTCFVPAVTSVPSCLPMIHG